MTREEILPSQAAVASLSIPDLKAKESENRVRGRALPPCRTGKLSVAIRPSDVVVVEANLATACPLVS